MTDHFTITSDRVAKARAAGLPFDHPWLPPALAQTDVLPKVDDIDFAPGTAEPVTEPAPDWDADTRLVERLNPRVHPGTREAAEVSEHATPSGRPSNHLAGALTQFGIGFIGLFAIWLLGGRPHLTPRLPDIGLLLVVSGALLLPLLAVERSAKRKAGGGGAEHLKP